MHLRAARRNRNNRHRTGTSGAGPSVAIIGGGFGGIAAAVMLKRENISEFTIFEKAAGFGGTWWENTYPGAEVDTPSLIYSYSFHRYPWSRTHANQAELLKYIEEAVDNQNLRHHFRLETPVREVRWIPDGNHYKVTIGDAEVEYFDAVISAVGFLNTPNIPELPGLQEYTGRVFHTTQWPATIALEDKDVAVIGTGSSSVQVVSAIADDVKSLTVFQRQPNWVLPKAVHDYTPQEVSRLARPWAYRIARIKAFIDSENGRIGGKEATAGTRANLKRQGIAARHLTTALASKPELISYLMPDYPFYGKRPVINDDFYPTLLKPNVALVPKPCVGFGADCLIDADGAEHKADIVVMATGFKAAEYLSNLKVYGNSAQELHEQWGDDPSAFLGITVPEFPNFFMLYGPNTNAGPVVFFLECQAQFAAKTIAGLRHRGSAAAMVRPAMFRGYDRWVQRRLKKTVWGKTDNYFKSKSGRVVTQWPTGASQYWLLTRLLRPLAMTYKETPGA